MSTYRIEASRTPRGSLIVDWPTGFAHDQLVSAIADELEDEMIADRSLPRIVITIEVDDSDCPSCLRPQNEHQGADCPPPL